MILPNSTAILFPGQGAHSAEMLDGLENRPNFASYYSLVSQLLGFDPLKRIKEGQSSVNENAISSLMTSMASLLSWESLEPSLSENNKVFAGYSVGQITALCAAGYIHPETMFELIYNRASYMDACFDSESGKMVAVIGLETHVVEEVCSKVRGNGHVVALSNYNCPGQHSVAGTSLGIQEAVGLFQEFKPRKIVNLEVSGAWHCSLLEPAKNDLTSYLKQIDIHGSNKVVDNVTARILPESGDRVVESLGQHLVSPVKWHQSVNFMIDSDVGEFIEVGFGHLLRNFSFFINRDIPFRNFFGKCVE